MERNFKSTINQRIPQKQVCMVNDKYITFKNLPVVIDDKLYYGCSEYCVDILKSSDKFRFGKEPHTEKKVDKADAYIVRQSDITDAVFYFKSRENYSIYIYKKSS